MADKDLEGDKLLFEEKEESGKKEDKSEKLDKKSSTKSKKSVHHNSDSSKKRLIEQNEDGISFNYKHISPFMVERIIYIIIILVLLVFVFKGCSFPSIGSVNISTSDSANSDVITGASNNTIVQNSSSTKTSEDQGTGTGYWGKIDGKCIQLSEAQLLNLDNVFNSESKCKSSSSSTASATASDDDSSETASETCDEGDITVEITKVETSGDNENKLEEVTIRVKNNDQKDLNGFMISLKAEQSTDTYYLLGTIRSNKIEYNTKVNKCGGTKSVVLDDELKQKYLPLRDRDIDLVVELFDSDEEEIDSAEYTLKELD
ncbi:hypothetical protein H6503_02745 [Candidatus Woesearchaeota archaeon]|nr:hypothetical protein [Candidatus Woesearchaeota archaeon]